MATNSQRALGIKDVPEDERPLSEQFRITAKEWVEAKKAWKIVKDTSDIKLSREKQKVKDATDEKLSDAEAGRRVMMTEEWEEHVLHLVELEAEVDLLRVKMKWIELRYGEWQSEDANARKERHMGRQTT